ncbi:MAG TPA: response regulator [Geothermobacteraceae bacterium]|nr:response regulator [Geothermobacteraceae bacterium]
MSRLLVVDDEQDICRLFAAELEDEGYQVETAGSAAAAADLLTSREFDLVVLDIQMPGESGLQTLQEIVRDKPDLPVILCTAYSCYKDDFSSWLADGYVVKSSDTSELKNEIARVLDKRRKSMKQ